MSTPTIGERRIEVRPGPLVGFSVNVHELKAVDVEASHEAGSTWGSWQVSPVCWHWRQRSARHCAAWLETKLNAKPYGHQGA